MNNQLRSCGNGLSSAFDMDFRCGSVTPEGAQLQCDYCRGQDVGAAQAERQLAEAQALLRGTKSMLARELSYELYANIATHVKAIDAFLSASAKPEVKS